MAATKTTLLMLMIACFATGGLGFLLAIAASSSSFMIYSIPGLVVGAFFAWKYASFDKQKLKEEEHKRRRNKH